MKDEAGLRWDGSAQSSNWINSPKKVIAFISDEQGNPIVFNSKGEVIGKLDRNNLADEKSLNNGENQILYFTTATKESWDAPHFEKETFNKIVEARDEKLHKAYFGMLAFIYDRLSPTFKQSISKPNFYIFLKEIGKEYKVLHTFKDGTEFKEYNSISFGRMNNTKFKLYFNNQLSVIYEDLLFPLGQEYLMDEINKEWEATLNKLI